MTDKDPYLGERFEDRDSRNEGRVIVPFERVEKIDPWNKRYVAYKCRTDVHPSNPKAVGRTVRVGAHTLDNKYRKVSR